MSENEEKIALTLGDGDDRMYVKTPKGEILCTLDRDDTNVETAAKVIRALGFRFV